MPLFASGLAALMCLLSASCSSDSSGPYSPKPGTSYDPQTGLPLEIISKLDQAEMVLVKPGAFRKGDPAGIGVYTEMKAFYVDKYEVTNERYQRFTSAVGHATPALPADDAVLVRWAGGQYPPGRAKYPVVLVSFQDARAFAEWAGKRLPSELEWEYAARGTHSQPYPWGHALLPVAECNTADRLAGHELPSSAAWQDWYDGWAKRKPVERNAEAIKPVGSFPKDVSSFGCIDMGGNVREWCAKQPGNGSTSSLEPETASGSAVSGASWLTRALSAAAWQHESVNSSLYYDVGFRCVASGEDPAIRALVRPPAMAK